MDRRSEGRHRVALQGVCRLSDESRHHVVITNLSCAGCCISDKFSVTAGDRLHLSLPGLGSLAITVKWTQENVIGIVFAEALDHAVVAYLSASCPQAA